MDKKFYFAPMEGITGYVYRSVHHRFFPGVDKYFTPFLSPGPKKLMTPREKNDILPEHNEGIFLVPQILTNQADCFIKCAKDVGRILRTFKIKKNVEVTDNGKIII